MTPSTIPLPEYRRPIAPPQRWAGELLRRSLGRAYADRQRPRARGHLSELRTLEFAPLATVQAVQLARLRELLTWACAATPHYREHARAAGLDPRRMQHAEDVAAFPILTKQDLRDHADRLVADGAIPRADWQINASGGSTGEPVRLFQDAAYWRHAQAAQWFMESWWGVRPGEPMALIWGTDRDIRDRSWRERWAMALTQARWLNAFSVTTDEMGAFAAMLHRWQPPFIAGYASALRLFAGFLLDHPQWRIRPRAVKSTAEVLRPDERAVIAQAFDAPVYDFYGSREVNVLAAECPAHAGLHVNTWSRYIELVDDDAQPVAPGVPGRVLVTDMTNRAQPMIRYENGDVGVWSGRPCPCGRPFPLLDKIVGRKSDFIHATNGKLIHGEFFTHLFYDQPNVRAFQVVQENRAEVRVDIELAAGELAPLTRSLAPAMERALGTDVRLEFRQVRTIPRSPSGKRRFTISHVKDGRSGSSDAGNEMGAAQAPAVMPCS